jgi:alpha-tubulin suppressor-like RCC1 family protein
VRQARCLELIVLVVGALAIALGCYHPRLIDCVLGCDVSRACPATMTCSAGLCTRGATCLLGVAAGERHSCAIVGSEVECWGNNSYGQLGIGSTQDLGGNAAPLVPVDLGGRQATAIAAGARHTCAVTAGANAATGAALCWGDNAFGQLGLADGRARGGQPGDMLDAVPLPAPRTVADLTAGLFHTCALLDDANVVCWGDNRFGQLGVTPGGDTAVPANLGFTPVSLGEPARAVSAGAYHTCALLASGAVRCWGWNDHGQLGDAAQPGGDVVPGLLVPVSIPAARAIGAGAFHTCVVLETGDITCWGQDDAGQVGVPVDPALGIRPPGSIVDLGPGRTGRAIGAGASHSCALLDDFSIKCWGYNIDGELGIGTSSNRGDDEPLGADLPPVALGSLPVSRLALGANHTCAIQAAGVKCWGLNDSGRLGSGDSINRGDDPSHPIGFVNIVP